MSEWKEYKLGDLTLDGKGHYGIAAPAVDYDSSKYTYLRITDINDDGTLNKQGLKSVDDVNAGKYLLKPNDIVFARTGASVGRSYFYDGSDGDLVYAGFLIKFSLDPNKVNPYMLKLYTHSQDYYDWIKSVDNGATRGNINALTFASMPIVLPSRYEQDKIVGVLGALDDKIDLLNRENATLEALAETLFRHYFIENPNPTWKEGKLGDVAKIGIGRTPPRKETKWFSYTPKDVKWISIKDMGEQGAFIFNTSETLTKERIGITTETMLSNEAIAHFLLDDYSPITKEYLYLYLKSYKFDTLGSTSSIVTSINSAMIKDIEMTIPDKETMNIFKAQVMPLFEKIKFNQQQMQTLAIQRDMLLPRLMSGEVKVSE